MKRSTVNQRANREMKAYCQMHGIFYCEVCGNNYLLTFAHRHKRRWYYNKPVSWLWKRSQWRLLCLQCHEHVEYDDELTEKLFDEPDDDYQV